MGKKCSVDDIFTKTFHSFWFMLLIDEQRLSAVRLKPLRGDASNVDLSCCHVVGYIFYVLTLRLKLIHSSGEQSMFWWCMRLLDWYTQNVWSRTSSKVMNWSACRFEASLQLTYPDCWLTGSRRLSRRFRRKNCCECGSRRGWTDHPIGQEVLIHFLYQQLRTTNKMWLL